MQTWPDEQAFHAADARRRMSAELDFGATWRAEGSNDAWRLAWILDTGELYLCRADSYDGSCTDVTVLAVLPDEGAVERLLEGWRDQREQPDAIGWLHGRLGLLSRTR